MGNETKPYLRAEKIYWYVMEVFAYIHVPHYRLEAAGIPESTYLLETGFGDCSFQSMYFVAYYRSLGIPPRAVSGYHSGQRDHHCINQVDHPVAGPDVDPSHVHTVHFHLPINQHLRR